MKFPVYILLLLVSFSSCKASSYILPESYPVQISEEKVYLFDTLVINYQNLKLKLTKGSMLTIDTEVGPTGLIIFSSGSFTYFNTLVKQTHADTIKSLVFMRFNPDEFNKIVDLKKYKPTPNAEICKRAWKAFGAYFRNNYHFNQDALIPKDGSYSIVIDGKNTGCLDYSYVAENNDNIIFRVKNWVW